MHRQLDDKTRIGGQIAPAEVAALADEGITLIVNNRPDGEDEGQPTGAAIEAAATAAGIEYRHVPIARGMGPSDVEAMRDAMHSAGDGILFIYCRSGNRSALAWAIAKNEDGVSREELERALREAGFNPGPIEHLLRD